MRGSWRLGYVLSAETYVLVNYVYSNSALLLKFFCKDLDNTVPESVMRSRDFKKKKQAPWAHSLKAIGLKARTTAKVYCRKLLAISFSLYTNVWIMPLQENSLHVKTFGVQVQADMCSYTKASDCIWILKFLPLKHDLFNIMSPTF